MIDNLIKKLNESSKTSKNKGNDFEKFIAYTLQICDYTIIDWTTDNYDKRKGIKVKSSSNPDLVIQDNDTNQKFAIECKYRARLNGLSEKLAENYQIWNYIKFSKDNNLKTYLLLGVGGYSSNPENIYLIPVDKLKNKFFEIDRKSGVMFAKTPFVFYSKNRDLQVISQEDIK